MQTDQRTYELLALKLWAHGALDDPDTIILDSETTGLDDPEICQLSIIDTARRPLFDEIICPTDPQKVLTPGKWGKCAADIHHLTPDKLEGQPSIMDRWEAICEVLRNRRVLIYNANYDWWQVLDGEARRHDLTLPPVKAVECVMLQYAVYVGEWNEYFGNYRWPKLPEGDHSALGDCEATLEVLLEMAGRHG